MDLTKKRSTLKMTMIRIALGWTFLVILLPRTDLLAELPELIPREVLFGDPDRMDPHISPDGKRVAYIAPYERVLNVWIRTVGSADDRVVTSDEHHGIRFYTWAQDNKHILYVQDREGVGNWHVYAVNLASKRIRDLTPFDGVQAYVVATEQRFPDEVLVAINRRDPRFHDVFRCNLTTGELTLEAENRLEFVGWVADREFRIRGALRPNAWGGTVLFVRDDANSPWRRLVKWTPQDAQISGLIGFTPDGSGLFIVSSTNANTGQLRKTSIDSGDETVLAKDDHADVAGIVVHPSHKLIQAVSFLKERRTWKVLDESIAADFAAIAKIRRGDFGIINRDHADRTWLVYFETDDGPTHYYAYERPTQKAELLFTSRKALEGVRLAQMKPIQFKARDGQTLHGYVTTPRGLPPVKLPTVLNVHDGPWQRDAWGYNGEVQWLANRGYAVLQVNFRGSTGYGKDFLNAGNREWGGKMSDDLVDAVDWAVKEGIADPKRIAMYGGSYGGYATLVGLVKTPDLFACGVDVMGPSNLITFLETIPLHWKPLESILIERVGHPQRDAEFLKLRSPLFQVDRITKPLLIAQGANDPRVKKSESQQIVTAVRKSGKTVEYVEYADEGHGLVRPENRLDFYARAEQFLAAHLGGRYQPAKPVPAPEKPENVK